MNTPTLPFLELARRRPQPLSPEAVHDRLEREHAVDHVVEAIHELVRDGDGVVTVRIEGLTRECWDDIDARPIGSWKKREELRNPDGGLIAAIDFETDESFTR